MVASSPEESIGCLEKYLDELILNKSFAKTVKKIRYDQKWDNYKPRVTGDIARDEMAVLVENMNDREELLS